MFARTSSPLRVVSASHTFSADVSPSGNQGLLPLSRQFVKPKVDTSTECQAVLGSQQSSSNSNGKNNSQPPTRSVLCEAGAIRAWQGGKTRILHIRFWVDYLRGPMITI